MHGGSRLAMAVITVAVLASGGELMAASAPARSATNVVLVHGAFADGSSWSKVIPLLQAKGLKVSAVGNTFRCYWDGSELTTSPIVDGTIATGWVGVYNFRFDLGSIPFYVDDLILDDLGVTPTTRTTWGAVKSMYGR